MSFLQVTNQQQNREIHSDLFCECRGTQFIGNYPYVDSSIKCNFII
jgi:hypothetical protein